MMHNFRDYLKPFNKVSPKKNLYFIRVETPPTDQSTKFAADLIPKYSAVWNYNPLLK
jgi:hypothetical protein